jgi:UPF0755 protein
MKKLFTFFLMTNVVLALAIVVLFQKKWSQEHTFASQTLSIPKGAGLSKVSQILESAKIIPDALDFKLFVKWKGVEKELKSGTYTFSSPASFQNILDLIKKGHSASVKVTIPEGRASWEIYSILKIHYPNLDSNKWEQLVHSSQFAKKLGLPGKNLEGFLLPETYYLPLAASETYLLTYLAKQHIKVWNSLSKSNSKPFNRVRHLGVVTLASIVEEETAVESERANIAGVFWNRTLKKMPLGADPTVRFIYRNLDGPIYKSQLNSNSPYNTRKFAGLPPGPISNPGKASLIAALQPGSTKDLYFVGKDNGTREHFFSSSLKDHNRFKNIAAGNRKKYGTAKGLY